MRSTKSGIRFLENKNAYFTTLNQTSIKREILENAIHTIGQCDV